MTTPSAFLNRTWVRCFAIALFVSLLFLPFQIPLKVVVLACGALIWTFMEAGNLRSIGMRRHRLAPTLIWGVGFAGAVIVVGAIVQPIIEWLTGLKPDHSAYHAIMSNPIAALKLLGFVLISAAFAEEVLFRGFLLHQLTAILGQQEWARRVSIVAAAVIFGLGHLIQGPLGATYTGLIAILMGWAWFRSERNLWALILAHALIDIYSLGRLYFGFVS